MIKRLLPILLIFFSIQCRQAEDDLSEAEDFQQNGDLVSALQLYNKVIQENPYLPDAYIQKGLCLQILHQPDSAIAVFRQLLQLFPENTASHYYAGITHFRRNNYKDAIACFNSALESKGGFEVEDTSSIQALLDRNKDRFESESNEIIIPSVEILYQRGMAYFKMRNVKKACVDFTNCILQDYNTASCYYMIGLCRLAKHEKKMARKSFLMAVQYGKNSDSIPIFVR